MLIFENTTSKAYVYVILLYGYIFQFDMKKF
jgi:hypothetical protein